MTTEVIIPFNLKVLDNEPMLAIAMLYATYNCDDMAILDAIDEIANDCPNVSQRKVHLRIAHLTELVRANLNYFTALTAPVVDHFVLGRELILEDIYPIGEDCILCFESGDQSLLNRGSLC